MGLEALRIEKMDVACVQSNQVLAMGVDGRDIERCKRAAKEFGALTPPTVGKLPDGGRIVLGGGCEFAALREMGVRQMDAVAVDIASEGDGAKISLLLASLRRNPDALCEGMLIKRALEVGGVTQSQICAAVGKSPAWVSKRLALATRLDPGVLEMVSRQILDPGSAQEICRLPADEQHAFAVCAVRDNLPKSAIEKLVSGFAAEECPEDVRRQIIGDPHGALPRFTASRVARYIPACVDTAKLRSAGIADQIAAVDITVSLLGQSIHGLWPETATPFRKTLERLSGDFQAMIAMIQKLVSPGKTENKGDTVCQLT